MISAEEISSKNKRYYSELYSRINWKKTFWFDYVFRRRVFEKFVKKNLKQLENLKIFEHGFGDGKLLLSFPRNNELYGTEIVDTAIRLVEPKCAAYKHCELRIIEEEEIPFPTGSFDLTICSHVLEHIPNDRKIINELKRVTKREGKIVVVMRINEESGKDPRHIRTYQTKQFLKLMKEAGLKTKVFTEYDRLANFYNLWYFTQAEKGSVPLHIKIISVVINLFLLCLPFLLVHAVDKFIGILGINPQQLILIVEK